jgi:hypothetical protein
MIGIALFIVLLVLGIRAFLALRRESVVRREFGRSSLLDGLVLLYPMGPVALLVGPFLLPQVLLFGCVFALFVFAYLVASKERTALECSGTNRVNGALAAVSTASLGAIVGLIYLGVAGTFAFIGYAIQSQPLGA